MKERERERKIGGERIVSSLTEHKTKRRPPYGRMRKTHLNVKKFLKTSRNDNWEKLGVP